MVARGASNEKAGHLVKVAGLGVLVLDVVLVKVVARKVRVLSMFGLEPQEQSACSC